MNTFEFTAFNAQAEKITETITAETQKEAIQKIRDKGLFPIEIKMVTTKETPHRETKINDEKIPNNNEEIPTNEAPKGEAKEILDGVMKVFSEHEEFINKMACEIGQWIANYKPKSTLIMEKLENISKMTDLNSQALLKVIQELTDIITLLNCIIKHNEKKIKSKK